MSRNPHLQLLPLPHYWRLVCRGCRMCLKISTSTVLTCPSIPHYQPPCSAPCHPNRAPLTMVLFAVYIPHWCSPNHLLLLRTLGSCDPLPAFADRDHRITPMTDVASLWSESKYVAPTRGTEALDGCGVESQRLSEFWDQESRLNTRCEYGLAMW